MATDLAHCRVQEEVLRPQARQRRSASSKAELHAVAPGGAPPGARQPLRPRPAASPFCAPSAQAPAREGAPHVASIRTAAETAVASAQNGGIPRRRRATHSTAAAAGPGSEEATQAAASGRHVSVERQLSMSRSQGACSSAPSASPLAASARPDPLRLAAVGGGGGAL